MRGVPLRHEIIREIALAVTAAGGAESIIRALVEATARGLGAKGCSLHTLREDGEQLDPRFSCGIDDSRLRERQILEGASLERVLEGAPLFISQVDRDSRVTQYEALRREGVVSVAFLPFGKPQGIRGIMALFFTEAVSFDREDLEFLESIAELSGSILQSAEMRDRLESDADQARRDLARIRDERRHFLGFLSMVTHDLKSPLVAVEGYLKLLLHKSAACLDERMVKGIHRSIERLDGMMELISDLLELSRLESGQVITELKAVSWDEVLGAAVEMAHELASPKNITVATEIRRPLPEVFASDVRLQQLILNLVSNSVRHTPRGGRITIRAWREEDAVRVDVEDDGVGIAPEHLPHVFKEFYRGDPESPEGTGLGLSICKRIVDMHHGEILITSPVSAAGKGTLASFRIPLGVTCLLEERWMLDGESDVRFTAVAEKTVNGKGDLEVGDG